MNELFPVDVGFLREVEALDGAVPSVDVGTVRVCDVAGGGVAAGNALAWLTAAGDLSWLG